MFNEEFFPTPMSVIQQMLSAVDYKGKTILEPSAGKGDILDVLRDRTKYTRTQLYAIEQEPELVSILHGKNYRVIGNDFLSYKGDLLFDLIVMNPPFSNGDKHLLKAWETLHAGEIVCLLNAETIKNPHTRTRQLLAELIQQHGNVKYLGNAFSTAERRTNVEIAMVTLKKQAAQNPFDFQFKNVTTEAGIDLSEESLKDQVATMDVVGNMILQFGAMKNAFTKYMEALAEMQFYATGLLGLRSVQTIANETAKGTENRTQWFNAFATETKQLVWIEIMNKLDLQKFMTQKVRQNFHEFAKQQGYMDLTKENVASIVAMLFENQHTIMAQAVEQVFDTFTQYHEDNRVHVEGWKTNSAYKVNRKVILPYMIEMSFSGCYRKCYGKWDSFSDIEKVMCYVSGVPYDSIKKLEDYIAEVRIGDNSLHTSEFFDFRCYKKGTIHLIFKDEWIWKQFNYIACHHKQWLPESDKKQWQQERAARGLPQLNA